MSRFSEFPSARVPILDRPEGRSQLKALAIKPAPPSVPILDRPEGRSQRSPGFTAEPRKRFQSSIAPKDDRNQDIQKGTSVTVLKRVPILDRPEGRSQLWLDDLDYDQEIVPILDRPEGRSQLCIGTEPRPWRYRFQSSIAPKDDRNTLKSSE